MTTKITVPALGESVTEATVSKWFKQVGDVIAADEPLVELETEKVTVEVPAPIGGTLENISVAEGDDVEVGAVLGAITEAAIAAVRAGGMEAPGDIVAPGDGASTGGAPSSAPVDVAIPDLGESVTEGTIGKWLKSVGDAVAADEALVEVETEKVTAELPSPVAGVLSEILVAEGTDVEVGAVVGRITPGDAPAAAVPAPAPVKVVP
ncbi:MAG: biotin/lipoyl-containing protein, partial [Alphaproteobacteria bacterium]